MLELASVRQGAKVVLEMATTGKEYVTNDSYPRVREKVNKVSPIER